MKLPPYPKYKPSGVEWLGNVPEHWEVKRLKYSSSINDEVLPETTSPDFEFEYVDIGGVSGIEGITTIEQVIFESAPSRARRKVRHGDTIVSTVRTYLRAIAPINNSPENLIVSTGFAVIRPRTVESTFLAYALRESSFIESVVARSVGVSYPAVNASEVGDIPIPLPAPAEQRSISAFLDRETGRIDRLVAKKRELIERLKEKRTALISRTVTRGLPAEAAAKAGLPANPPLKRSGIAWLGDIPKHWEAKRLQYLFRFTSGGTPPTETAEYWEGDLPWVSPKDMKCFHLSDTIDHVSELALKETSTTAVLPETMLLVARSGILKHSIPVAITTRRMTINQDIKGVTPLRKNASVYFYAWFIEGHQSELLTEWRKEGATVESLDLERVKNCALPFPPLAEQAAIARYLDVETAKLDALIGKVEEAIERLQEFRTALITAAVTGKIDVRKAAAA